MELYERWNSRLNGKRTTIFASSLMMDNKEICFYIGENKPFLSQIRNQDVIKFYRVNSKKYGEVWSAKVWTSDFHKKSIDISSRGIHIHACNENGSLFESHSRGCLIPFLEYDQLEELKWIKSPTSWKLNRLGFNKSMISKFNEIFDGEIKFNML